jgi:hypothetical protein
LKVSYVYEVSNSTIADAASLKTRVTDKVCASPLAGVIPLGVTYAYEYWHDGDLLDTINVTSCA